jgi:hypothetical protein
MLAVEEPHNQAMDEEVWCPRRMLRNGLLSSLSGGSLQPSESFTRDRREPVPSPSSCLRHGGPAEMEVGKPGGPHSFRSSGQMAPLRAQSFGSFCPTS